MLVFLGAPGVGKTYFCSALFPWVMKKHRFFRYFNERELLARLRGGIASGLGGGDYLNSLKMLLDQEFIFLDDIGSSGFNEWRREVIFDAIDQRYESRLPTVITSNLNRKQLEEGLGGRAVSRLFASENLVIEMHDGVDLRKEGK